jgi:hypothetical protein
MTTITKTRTTHALGTFEAPTQLTVSDPCYLDEDYSGPLTYGRNPLASAQGLIAPGEWVGFTDTRDFGDWGTRVTNAEVRLVGGHATGVTDAIQGVDAGFVGFFFGEPELSYDDACQVSLSVRDAKAVQYGAGKAALFTSSGFGDGGYAVTIGWHEGQIVSVAICFVTDEEN